MEIREKYSKVFFIILVIFSISLIWSMLQFLAPIALSSNSVEKLDGVVGFVDNQDEIDEMSFPWNSVYKAGDKLCHQLSSRSFFINGNQMPFCARCSAIWIGLTISVAFMLFYRIKLDEKFLFILILGIIPIAIDGLGQLFSLWESSNLVRVLTGGLIGVISGIAIGLIIDEISLILKDKKKKQYKKSNK